MPNSSKYDTTEMAIAIGFVSIKRFINLTEVHVLILIYVVTVRESHFVSP